MGEEQMMKIARGRAVRVDQEDRFDFFKARQLGCGAGSRAGFEDMVSDDDTAPEAKYRILDWSSIRSTVGLFRTLMPGLLLASACLAGSHGAQAAPPASRQGAIWPGETGVASYYGSRHQGRRTASGGRFEQKALTAAHPWLPFGTKVRVTVETTGRSVVVTITDRLPSRRRVIDLSLGAARLLGIVSQGLAKVSLTPA
jgi:rare lipoprotein A